MGNLFASSVLAPMMAGAIPLVWWLAPIGAIAALIAAYVFYTGIMQESEGTPEMQEIAQAVREGAMAYLSAQYRVVGVVFAALFIIFLIMSFAGVQNFWVTIAFLSAGFFSGAAGYIGMRTATNASARTANAARKSLNDGLRVAFRAGAVMGLTVVGFILLDSSIWFLLLHYVIQPAGGVATVTSIMLSAAVGASTMALFGRVGGGIYTKAADVGADLVGKVEAGIPEDDPRNPATIADNVGDNVGDVAGMGADLYESYLASILSTAALGVAAAAASGHDAMLYITAPFMLAGVGVLISILGVFRVRAKDGATMKDLLHALEGSTQLAGLLIAAAAFGLLWVLGLPNYIGVWVAVVAGLGSGIAIGRVTEYYTSADYKPTQNIAEQAATGPATVIIQGLAVGMESAALPVIIIVIGTAIAFFGAGGGLEGNDLLNGLFGVGMAAVGMLSTLGLTLATDAYGPVADNAGGNAEMANLPPEVRERTDQLDALGNTTAAIGKGFAIGSAALTGLALLAAYLQQVAVNLNAENPQSLDQLVEHFSVTPLNPMFLFGLLLGGMVSFYFCALTMSAVGRSAGAMVEEVRRQFAIMRVQLKKDGASAELIAHPDQWPNKIMVGNHTYPDYPACVEISTQAALKEMVVPSVLAIVVPAVVAILFGVSGVLGLLAGALGTGFSLAIMMANAGGAWDNAKKYVEAGNLGGKGSEIHKATVVGDTVGDPFKDTSGPALNILIKLMSVVSVVLAGLTAAIGDGFGLLGMLLGLG
ncbi:MAG: sodium-translocating pyrophosphatase [Candidatus Promineifilaceae bacterium]